MRIIELFAGIGACSKALKNIGVDLEIVDVVEIDKYAIRSFNAIHGTNFDVQDIKEFNTIYSNIDMITHGSPCQDVSLAGKQAGADKDSGTRSSLLYETLRIVEQIKPKYVLWENVKNLLSQKHKHNFDKYIETLDVLGYNSYYQVLNAKDYGIPQNRERVYTVSIRKDIDNGKFVFPKKEELKLRLKDFLEDDVDEKYYLSDTLLQGFVKHNIKHEEKGTGFIWKPKKENDIANCLRANASLCPTDNTVIRKYGVFDTEKSKHQAGSVYETNALCPTLDTMQGGWRQPCIEIKNATKKGYDEAIEGDSINLAYPNSETRRARVGHQVSQTIMGSNTMGTVTTQMKIRRLTPLECWRLMGFDDEDFLKAKKIPTSNTQLYKQAGNSIVVKVLEKIFKNLLKE